jgi:hypothetical protein
LSFFEIQILNCPKKFGWRNNQNKVVDLDELYNFVVTDFFIWNHLESHNSIWSSYILKFKFWVIQTKLDGEMTKTKIVDLDKLYNFVVDDLLIEIIYSTKIIFKVYYIN